MTQNQTSKELLELLNETREYTRFLKELGVENIGEAANDSAVPLVVVSASQPARAGSPNVSDQVKFTSTRSATTDVCELSEGSAAICSQK